MLPSAGDFKAINCPFYDSGLCERPYCHFRHVKKDSQHVSSNDIGSGILHLVSEAVKKVLQQTETTASSQQVLSVNKNANEDTTKPQDTNNTKVTYNPTPISELNKINGPDVDNLEASIELKRRHIPVPYTPIKPANPIKRPIHTNGSHEPLIYIPPTTYTPGSTNNNKVDPYLPVGSSNSSEKYNPGIEKELQAYTVESSNLSKVNYVPSDKKKKLLEYKPTIVKPIADIPRATYQPTPLSRIPCFSSDEEEPVAKKKRASTDINELDGLETEFEMLDQILDEEKMKDIISNKSISVTSTRIINESNSIKEVDKPKKKEVEKDSLRSEKRKDSKKTSSLDRKSSRKDKDKEKDKLIHKSNDSSDKRGERSSSKSSDKKDSKYRENRTSKSSSNDSKHSKSKDETKDKDKRKDDKHKGERKKSEKHRDRHKDDKRKEKSKSEKSRKHSESRRSKDKSSSKSSSHKSETEKNGHLSDDDNSITEFNNEGIDEISDSDEETIALECKRIFEEYVPTEKVMNNEDNVTDNNLIEEEYIPTKKRISRTSDKNIKIVPKTPLKPNFKVSAASTMSERVSKVRKFHESKESVAPVETSNLTETQRHTFSAPLNSSKIRIAHVPYASNMLNAKKVITSKPIVNPKSDPSTSSTPTQTVKKGSQRVAHMPSEKFIDRPGVLEPLASKIAANVRSLYLNMMIDECLKIYTTAEDAYARAQHEELTTSKKCSTVQIYKNSSVLTVSRLRKEGKECNGKKKSAMDCSTLISLSGSKSSISWSIESKKNINSPLEFAGVKFYKNISKWILTQEQLKENGFPRPHPSSERGRAIIYNVQNKKKPPKGFIRACCRCNKEYTIDKKGFPVTREDCIYHPNRQYKFRGESRYQCCGQDGSSDGCCMAPTHVSEYIDYDNLKGYVKTLSLDHETDDYGVYALDCEMCYTTQGLDLTRVTVINSSCKVVYESLIKPLHPILDYNTRYSGITEEQMMDVKTTLLEVQATLLSMFNSKTILLGHSLESDFKALKLIHDTVIDTSVLFPHKMGPPFKRALRNLSSEYLKKIIQNSVDGHDSAEDATVCMELIHYKLKEDLKTR